nr:ribosomal protein S11 [Dracocephalum heterophyllum]UYL26510.1 ribosomal protein S11 [Dracocephalum heterophyllum]
MFKQVLIINTIVTVTDVRSRLVLGRYLWIQGDEKRNSSNCSSKCY